MNNTDIKNLFKQKEILERTFRLGGEVNSDSINRILEKIIEWQIKDPEKPSVLHLTSGGGFTSQEISFYDTLQIYQPNLYIVTSGTCHSICVPLLLSVPREKRFATPHTSFLIHPSTITFNNGARVGVVQLQEEIEGIESLESAYINIVKRETLMKRKEINHEKSHNKLMTVKTAMDYGFISHILK